MVSFRKNLIHVLMVLFYAWTALWVNFLIRDLIRGKDLSLKDYKELLRRDSAGREAYAYGDKTHALLKKARDIIPEGASYGLSGKYLEAYSLEWRRSIYYLVPRVMSEDPEFLILYDSDVRPRDGFQTVAVLDAERTVLKRV